MSRSSRTADDFPNPGEPQRILDAARAAEASESTPRKHHLVPRSYLRRWEEDAKLRVTEVDSSRTYLTSAAKAARQSDYYRLESEDIDPNEIPPLLIETLLGAVEEPAVAAIDSLLDSRGERPDPADAAIVAQFLGVQYTRGRDYRAQVGEMVNKQHVIQYGDMTENAVRSMLARRNDGLPVGDDAVREVLDFLAQLKAGRIRIQPQDAWTMAMGLQQADLVARLLLTRDWHVVTTSNVLVTCDEPLVLIGGPGTPRTEQPGIASAGVIVFPLAPDALLVLFRADIAPPRHEPVLELVELAEVSVEIIAHSARWAFERPSRRTTCAMAVPPRAEVLQLHERVTSPDASIGEVIRMYRPSRWAAEPCRPWPVRRWWSWATGGDSDVHRAKLAAQMAMASIGAMSASHGEISTPW